MSRFSILPPPKKRHPEEKFHTLGWISVAQVSTEPHRRPVHKLCSNWCESMNFRHLIPCSRGQLHDSPTAWKMRHKQKLAW